jgi:hypothetical protein
MLGEGVTEPALEAWSKSEDDAFTRKVPGGIPAEFASISSWRCGGSNYSFAWVRRESLCESRGSLTSLKEGRDVW